VGQLDNIVDANFTVAKNVVACHKVVNAVLKESLTGFTRLTG
jgi:stress-induced morphogen